MTAIVQRSANGLTYLACDGTQGTPTVLLHGIGSNAHSFRPLMQALEAPSFAWNAPGYDTSQPLAMEWPDAFDYAAVLQRLLAHIGLSRCVLVGHSLGCLIAGRFAVVSPERIAALVLISPALGYGTHKGDPLPPAVAGRIEALDRLGTEKFAAARAPSLLADPAARPDVLRSVERAMAAIRRPGYDQAARLLAGGQLLDDAARIAVPTAVLVGSQDRITPPENARRLFKALRDSSKRHRYEEIHNAGHAVCQEEPAQVARMIAQFVEREMGAHA